MPDQATVVLMSELARLLSGRSSTPRSEALSIAHRKIREFAEVRNHSEDWCDAVLLSFLGTQGRIPAAA